MLLKPVALVAVVWAGFGLGAAPLKVRGRLAAVTVLVAALLHLGLRLLLPHENLEEFGQRYAHGTLGAPVLAGIAAVETLGLWIPVAVARWTSVRGRAWATVYLISAAALAATTYYFPFDVEIVNGEVMRPMYSVYEVYEVGIVMSVPFAAFGYLGGRLKRRMSSRVR
jgi:hypothetical protein